MADCAQTISGYNAETRKNLLLDAGAYLKNFDISTDVDADGLTSAGKAKIIGATRGGGEFTATADMRTVEIDGIKGVAKGASQLNSWTVTLTANFIETTSEIIKMALGAAEIDSSTNQSYDIVKARNCIDDTDYFDNITFVGTLSGTKTPIIISVKNAMGTNGLTITTEDQNEAVVPVTFTGHYDETDLSSPPFEIYRPKNA